MSKKHYISIGWIPCPCGKTGFAYLYKGRLEVKHPLRVDASMTFGADYSLQAPKQKTCYIKKGKAIEQVRAWFKPKSPLNKRLMECSG